MTVGEWLSDAVKELTEAGTSSQKLDADLILGHVLGQSRTWLAAHDADRLSNSQSQEADALLHRRASREPLVHLTQSREFYGLDLRITPQVLTPRVETEQMVTWALKYAPEKASVIDVGTGSGAIAIALKKTRPDLQVTATEVSDEALGVARENALHHETEITFVSSDLWDQIHDSYDVVVTNLPYLQDDADLMPEVTHEPAVALFGGPDGLGLYRRFLKQLPAHLKPNGYLFTECDPWQHEELITLAVQYGLRPIEQGYFILGFQLITK